MDERDQMIDELQFQASLLRLAEVTAISAPAPEAMEELARLRQQVPGKGRERRAS
ncbi:MAG: hypothetical protein SFV54_00165 [Bryobacteraceae bacterium]|nr:hypothetical protein [Bryobacteraceae bacterium]